MRKTLLTIAAFAALAGGALAALTNTDFTGFGAGWTTYNVNSGSVTFDGDNAILNAIGPTNGAGLYQEDTAFATLGQEFSVTVTVVNTGNVRAGFLDSSLATGPNTVYANGETGPKTVVCDDPNFNHAFAEKAGAIGGIISIGSIVTTEITAAPTYPGAPGATSVSRVSDTSATLNWNEAADNVTPTAQIEYDIYWAADSADVFTEGVKETATGTTSMIVTGLPSNGEVFFGVRAKDRVGNGESNTTTVSLAAVLSADGWSAYE